MLPQPRAQIVGNSYIERRPVLVREDIDEVIVIHVGDVISVRIEFQWQRFRFASR